MSGVTESLLVFSRAPVPGQVKTRLIPALGAEGAAALHSRLLEHSLVTACRCAGAQVELWCHPDCSHPHLSKAVCRHGVVLRHQVGGDLGARMADAFATALAQSARAVLIGTDCPDLSPDHLDAAMSELRHGVDVVLGPAADGGYYLIGLNRPVPQLFADIAWGSDLVLQATRRRIHDLGLCVSELPVLRDVDRPEDLRHFPALEAATREPSMP